MEQSLYILKSTSSLETGDIIRFAKTEVEFEGNTYMTYRVIDRSQSNSWENTHVEFFKNGIHIENFQKGEDPRFLIVNKDLLLYFQEYSPMDNDCIIYIKNIRTGEVTTYNFPNRLGINGKNWGVFESNEDIRVLYSCDPLQCFNLKGGQITEEIFSERYIEHFWGDDLQHSFGSHRCGSMPIYDGKRDTRIAFTHVTLNGEKKPFHQLGALLFDSKFEIVRRIEISRYMDGLLIDPYFAQICDENIFIQFSATLGELHVRNSLVQNFELQVRLEDFYSLF